MKITAITDALIVRRTLLIEGRPQEQRDGAAFQPTRVLATWEMGSDAPTLTALSIWGTSERYERELGYEYKLFSPIPHMRMEFAPAWAREAAEANKPSA